MKTKDLRLFTLIYVNEHDSLTKDEKSYLFSFVKEATEYELMNLLVTGEAKALTDPKEETVALQEFFLTPVPCLLTEGPVGDLAKKGAEAYAKGAWNVSSKLAGGPSFKIPGGGIFKIPSIEVWSGAKMDRAITIWKTIMSASAGLAVGAVVTGVAYAAYKVYQNVFSKAAKQCKGKKGPEKKMCMNQAKLAAWEAHIKELNNKMTLCKKAKETELCKAKVLKKINSAKQKIAKAKAKRK